MALDGYDRRKAGDSGGLGMIAVPLWGRQSEGAKPPLGHELGAEWQAAAAAPIPALRGHTVRRFRDLDEIVEKISTQFASFYKADISIIGQRSARS
jgi:hypothetical protein